MRNVFNRHILPLLVLGLAFLSADAALDAYPTHEGIGFNGQTGTWISMLFILFWSCFRYFLLFQKYVYRLRRNNKEG